MGYWIAAEAQGHDTLFLCDYGWTTDRREALVYHQHHDAGPCAVTPPETGVPRLVRARHILLSDLRELGVETENDLPQAPPTGAPADKDAGPDAGSPWASHSETFVQKVTDAIANEYGTDNDHAVACVAVAAFAKALEDAGFAICPERATPEMLQAATGGDSDAARSDFARKYERALAARPKTVG